MSDPKAFTYDLISEPHVFIQWKGTDACLDFHCKCGASAHFDGDFAYVLKCMSCGTHWEMPLNLFPREITEEQAASKCVQELTPEYD